MNKKKQTDFYQTTDLALATVLSLSYPIEKVDKTNPKKAQFIFVKDKNIDVTIENYWKGSFKVEPQQFFNQLRVIKSRLYGGE